MEREGLTVESPKGGVVKHPLLPVVSQARDSLIRMCDALGLSPIGRERLNLCFGEIEDQDQLDRLLKGQR